MDIDYIKLLVIKVLNDYHWQILAVVILILIIGLLIKHRYYYQKKDYLCSQNERRLLNILNKLLPKTYHVHCQTSLISLLKPNDLRSARMVWAKRLDFVITDKNSKILLVIELDDPSHERKDRKKRDKFVNKVLAGKHPLVRITTDKAKDISFVRNQLVKYLGTENE